MCIIHKRVLQYTHSYLKVNRMDVLDARTNEEESIIGKDTKTSIIGLLVGGHFNLRSA